MRLRTICLVATIATAAALSIAVGAASANRLSISNRNFRVTWSALRFNPGEVKCQVTVEGSFHSATIQKVRGPLLGHISRAILKNETCTNGHATALLETLPWHVQYRSFAGRLPRFRGVTFREVGLSYNVRVEAFGITCVARTTEESPAETDLEVVGDTITSVRFNEAIGIPLTGACSFLGPGFLSGDGAMKLLGTTRLITIGLI